MNEPTPKAAPARHPCPTCGAAVPLGHCSCSACGDEFDPKRQMRDWLAAERAAGARVRPSGGWPA